MADVVAGRLRIELPKGIFPESILGKLWNVDTDIQITDVTKMVLVADANADGGRMYADLTRLADANGNPIDLDQREGCRSRGMPVADERGGYWTITQRWLVMEFL